MQTRRKVFSKQLKGNRRSLAKRKAHAPEIVAQAIILIPTNRLKLWGKNPKVYSKQDISKLAELYKKHGMSSPLVVWRHNMVVYKGNKSLRAARLAGMNRVPCILRKFTSEAAATAYGLSDNKAGDWGEWDEDMLSDVMSSKGMRGLKEATGFTERELIGVHDKWNYNPNKVARIEENEDSISHIIRLRVPQEFKEDLLEELETIVGDYHATII